MNHPHPNDETSEKAALYALGALDGEEVQAFERHLEGGCASCQAELEGFKAVVGHLGHSAKVVTPRDSLRTELMERVKREGKGSKESDILNPQAKEVEAGLTFVRASDELWQEVMPGILLKPLFVDTTQGRMTALVRMAPGVTYAPHRHTAPEEFYCLEGTCFIGGQLLHPGDYHRAETGTIHHETSTKDGCLILGIFSPNNEMLDPEPA